MVVRGICSEGMPLMLDELTHKYDVKHASVTAGVESGIYHIGTETEKRNFVADVFELRILANQLSVVTGKSCPSFDMVVEDGRMQFVPCDTDS